MLLLVYLLFIICWVGVILCCMYVIFRCMMNDLCLLILIFIILGGKKFGCYLRSGLCCCINFCWYENFFNLCCWGKNLIMIDFGKVWCVFSVWFVKFYGEFLMGNIKYGVNMRMFNLFLFLFFECLM